MLCLSALAPLSSNEQGHDLVQHKEELTPTQNKVLSELVDQFNDMFATKMVLTHLVRHDSKMLLSATVRQYPY